MGVIPWRFKSSRAHRMSKLKPIFLVLMLAVILVGYFLLYKGASDDEFCLSDKQCSFDGCTGAYSTFVRSKNEVSLPCLRASLEYGGAKCENYRCVSIPR